MSRSNPTLTNPSTRRFEWAGSAGVLRYYDRETKETIDQPLPFRFMVLDQLNTMTGFSKSDNSSIWANEVRDVKNDVMYTRIKSSPIEAGLYSELAETSRRGGKFAKSIYIAYELNGNWVIGNFRASGSAMTTWFDFAKSHIVDQDMIIMTRGEQIDGGTGPYFPPRYEQRSCSADEDMVATQLDKQLQTFLSVYLATPKVDEDGQGTDTSEQSPAGHATPEQQEHFDNLKRAGLTANQEADAYYKAHPGALEEDQRKADLAAEEAAKIAPDSVIDDIGDEPINLDDIPF